MKFICLYLSFTVYALSDDVRIALSPCKINYSIEARTITNDSQYVRLPVDFFVEIYNNMNRELTIYADDNSWGYECIKFIIFNGRHEYVVSKKTINWYRNFESFVSIKPKKAHRVPVIFSDSIWEFSGAEKDKSICLIRAIYDQPISKTSSEALKKKILWSGIASSPYYSITNTIKYANSPWDKMTLLK